MAVRGGAQVLQPVGAAGHLQQLGGHSWLSGGCTGSPAWGLQAQGAEMHLEATPPSHPKGETRECPRERAMKSQNVCDNMKGLCDITEWAVISLGSYKTS